LQSNKRVAGPIFYRIGNSQCEDAMIYADCPHLSVTQTFSSPAPGCLFSPLVCPSILSKKSNSVWFDTSVLPPYITSPFGLTIYQYSSLLLNTSFEHSEILSFFFFCLLRVFFLTPFNRQLSLFPSLKYILFIGNFIPPLSPPAHPSPEPFLNAP